MANETARPVVAVYWDFENLHAALYDRARAGGKRYLKPDSRNAEQDALVNVGAVMDYAASFGSVAVKRAYNNWQRFGSYRDVLNLAGIDLIQIYPRGENAKNGADIRLALDALEDAMRFPRLTHFVVVSGDSDFIGLAQKLKQLGRTVVGVGARETTNPIWEQNCDRFCGYDDLHGVAVAEVPPAPAPAREKKPAPEPLTFDDAEKLAREILLSLLAEKGVKEVRRAHLKNLMKQKNPEFDEGRLNFSTFTEFLQALPDVEVLPDKSGGRVRLAAVKKPPLAA